MGVAVRGGIDLNDPLVLIRQAPNIGGAGRCVYLGTSVRLPSCLSCSLCVSACPPYLAVELCGVEKHSSCGAKPCLALVFELCFW